MFSSLFGANPVQMSKFTDEIESKQGSVDVIISNGFDPKDSQGSALRYYEEVIVGEGSSYTWITNGRNKNGELTYKNPNYKAFSLGGKAAIRINGTSIPPGAQKKLYYSSGKLVEK